MATTSVDDKARTQQQAAEYVSYYDQSEASTRKEQYRRLINHYYDLVTDFYEFGWGRAFHFAPRKPGEKHMDALARHERYIADQAELGPGKRALDVGCGVGGPLIEIARYSGASIVGINNNGYQVEKGRKYLEQAGLADRCDILEGDFMSLPFEDESFDAVYAIEATCHSPDRKTLYKELYRVLKPGAKVAVYEWCVTDRYDDSNPDHRRIREEIERGDALPELTHTSAVDEAFEEAGFVVEEARDLAPLSEPPWYQALTGRDLSLWSLPRTPVGRALTNLATRVLERVRLAPKGTTSISTFLNRAADALVEGGRREIFTPMYLVRARRPEAKGKGRGSGSSAKSGSTRSKTGSKSGGSSKSEKSSGGTASKTSAKSGTAAKSSTAKSGTASRSSSTGKSGTAAKSSTAKSGTASRSSSTGKSGSSKKSSGSKSGGGSSGSKSGGGASGSKSGGSSSGSKGGGSSSGSKSGGSSSGSKSSGSGSKGSSGRSSS